VCDLETSRMGAPYIYDISRLRVKIISLFVVSNIQYSNTFYSVQAGSYEANFAYSKIPCKCAILY